MNVFIFIISTLATYRLSLMFSSELGPCSIFERIRALFNPNGCWHKGISCIMCETVWWSGIISLWMMVIGVVPWNLVIIYWMSASAGAVLINEQWPQK